LCENGGQAPQWAVIALTQTTCELERAAIGNWHVRSQLHVSRSSHQNTPERALALRLPDFIAWSSAIKPCNSIKQDEYCYFMGFVYNLSCIKYTLRCFCLMSMRLFLKNTLIWSF